MRVSTGLRWLLLGVLTVVACSSSRSDEAVGRTSQALSTTGRVLSFEQPTTDWVATDLNLQQGNQFVDGAHSAAVTVVNSGGKLTSIPLTSLGPISSTVTLQVRLPSYVASPTWQGQVALRLNSPTAGVWSQYYGPVPFQNSPVGAFHQIQFTLPPAIVTALSTSTYSDLTVAVELDFSPNPNSAAGFSDPFYIDKLDFGQSAPVDGGAGGSSSGAGGASGRSGAGGAGAGGAGAGGTAGTAGASAGHSGGGAGGASGSGGSAGVSGGTSGPCPFTPPSSSSTAAVPFSIKLPRGVRREDIAIGTTGGYLTLDDGVRVIKDGGGFASVSNVAATNRASLGVSAEVQDIYSELTGIDLRSNAHVHGIAKTAADVALQAGATVDGATSPNANLEPLESVTWTASFPTANRGSCSLEPDNTEIIDPGSYGDVAIKSRSHLKIRSGTYFFNSLSFEPQAFLDIANTAGPVFIYVRTTFAFSGTVAEADPTHMNFLFGVAGNGNVNIQTAFRGILVAPSAGVNLPTDSNFGHVGAFFANALIAHQTTNIHLRPFAPSEFCTAAEACSSFCPCGSDDGTCTALPNSDSFVSDPNCIDGACCAASLSVVTLGSGADSASNSTANTCVVALGGNDTLFSAAPGATVVGGAGDDTIAAGQFSPPGIGAPHVRVFGGPGKDTINGWFDSAEIYGGPGDDTISAGPGAVFVAPGSGVDSVSTGDGDDTFVLFDECEATPGKKLIANGGFDTLISPLSVEELRARGLTVEGFEKVVIQSNACKSDCTTKPTCGAQGQCVDRSGRAVCGAKKGAECQSCADCVPGLACTNGVCADGGGGTCVPSCANKECGDDLADGCGRECPGVCGGGQVGCNGDADCQTGLICGGTVAGGTTPTTCTTPECLDNPQIAGCGVPGAACGSSCTRNPTCFTAADCPTGYVCGIGNGYRYGVPTANVCELPGCETSPQVIGCGTTQAQCGLCACTPNCAKKHCGDADLSDGCGGRCASLCEDGDPDGCSSDGDCQAGSYCGLGQGPRLGLSASANVCLPARCAVPNLGAPDCGTLLSVCGLCPTPVGSCQGRECGSDPVTGATCGPGCADGDFCNASGTCITPVVTPPITVTDAGGATHPVVPPTGAPAPGFGATPGAFTVSEQGSASYSIPIDVPPGRHGIEPALSIRYTSSTGNGALGVGWSLDGLSTISLCQRTYAQDGQGRPVRIDNKDAFCLDGQRLISLPDNTLRTENDNFSKITVPDGGESGQPFDFKVFTKDGHILSYGLDAGNGEALANTKANPSVLLARTWALNRVEDRNGNFLRIVYRQTKAQDSQFAFSSSELVPDSITYTGNGSTEGDREIKFQYSDSRPDKLLGYQIGGGILARTLRLENIQVLASHALVRRYDLSYETAPNNVSRLISVQECAGPNAICKGATTFTYSSEQGFDAGTPFTPARVDPNLDSGAPEFFAPYGTALATTGGYDVLTTESDNATSIPTTPIPGGADMAVQVIPVGGQIAGAIIDLVNLFGASSYQQDWFVRVFNDFKKSTFSFGGRCSPRDRASEHMVRDLFGTEGIYDTCPGETLTWFIDVDGDGVQDRLQCSRDRKQVEYYLARNHGHQIPENLTNIPAPDGTVAEFANLCADPAAWSVWNTTIPQVPGGPPEPPFIAAFDVDGDGTSNLTVNDKTGWSALFFDGAAPEWRRLSTDIFPIDLQNRYVAFLDANGDGLRDILALPGPGTPNYQFPALWTNTGEGFKFSFLNSDGLANAAAPGLPAYVVDYDHDGIDDLIEPSFDHPPDCSVIPAGDANVVARLKCLNALQQWNVDSRQPHPWIIRHFNNGKITKETLPTLGPAFPGALGDFDGDGNLDLVTRKPGSNQYFMHHGSGRLQNSLQTVIDGLDRRVDIQYDLMNTEGDQTYTGATTLHPGDTNELDDNGTDCSWPNSCPRKLDHVLVSSYQESHRETAGKYLTDSDTRLSYHGEVDDAAGLGRLGFMSRLITVRDVAGTLRQQTSWKSIASPSSASSPTPIESPYVRTLVGLPALVSVRGPHADSPLSPTLTDNFQLTTTKYTWVEQTSVNGLPFAVLQNKDVVVTEEGAKSFTHDISLYSQSEQFTMDAYGNVTDHTVTGQDFDPHEIFFPVLLAGTESTYHVHDTFNPTADEINDWQISLLKAEDVTDQPRCSDGTVSCPSETRSRHTDYRYYNSGDLEQVTRAAGDSSAQLQTTLGRDGYGNIFQVTEIDAAADIRVITSAFDDRGMFPISVTNHLSQTTQLRYDDRFGRLAVRVDPNNISETWSYDDFGILRDYQGPGGEETTDYEPDGTTSAVGLAVMSKYRIIKHQLGGDTLVERHNSLGQLVAREISGLNGATVIEELGYDARDRLAIRSRPHLPGDASQGLIQLGYDDQDQLATEKFPNGSVVHHDHFLGLSVSADVAALLPSTGGVMKLARTTDAKGHVSYLFADRDGRVIQALDANNHPTSYSYGAFGAVEQIIGTNGTLSYTFDSYGRMLNSTDAAVGGQRTMAYNGLDELVSSLDPAGRNSTIFYDELGRQKRLQNVDGTSTWTYDEGANAIGRLSRMQGATGQQTSYAYEPPTTGSNRGLLASTTETLVAPGMTASTPPTVLTSKYHYDAFSRLEQIDYPADGAAAFSVKYGFDDAGHVVSVSNAADSSSVYWQLTAADQGFRPGQETFGNGVTTTRHYEDLTGYVSSIATKHGDNSVQQLSYGYDANGNLTHRADALTGAGESFGYDALNRVTSTTYSNLPTPEGFTYDPISNALSHQDHMGDYTYYSEGRDWVKSAGDTQYTHDAVGNIETRSGPSVPGTGQEFTYTTFDLPSHVSVQNAPNRGTDFGYDASGSRVAKQTEAETIFYANDLYQRSVSSAGAINHRFMIYADGRAIAAVSQPEDSGPAVIEYLHDDSLGSVQALTTSDASVVGNRRFDTFGDARGTLTNASQMPYGYTGQEQDGELGLVNMHGRLYDPQLGQFMSADPVIQSPFSQGLNRFAYAFNSPLNFTDPSGYSAEAGEDIAIGVGVAYFGGLAATLLTSGGEAGAAVEGTGASAAAASGVAVAGAEATSVGAIAQAAGVGTGFASSIAVNVLLSGRQAVSTIVSAQPSTRSATAAGNGPPPLSRGSYASMGTSPVQESAPQSGATFGQDPHAGARCGPAGGSLPVCGTRKYGTDPMDQIVKTFLNSQSIAPEYPGTVGDTLVNPDAPEHAANIVRTANGGFRLDVLQVSHIDTSRIFVNPPTLNPGERWVGLIHSHPQLPTETLAQSEGIDLPAARALSRTNINFRSSYVIGPSGAGPYLGVIVFRPVPGPGALITLGVGP